MVAFEHPTLEILPVTPMSTRNAIRSYLRPANSTAATEILNVVATLSSQMHPLMSRATAPPRNSIQTPFSRFCNPSEYMIVSHCNAVSWQTPSTSALFLLQTGRRDNHRLPVASASDGTPHLHISTSDDQGTSQKGERERPSLDPKSGGVHRFYLRFCLWSQNERTRYSAAPPKRVGLPLVTLNAHLRNVQLEESSYESYNK